MTDRVKETSFARWNDQLTKVLIDCLVEAKQKKMLESDNGITTKAWDWIQKRFEETTEVQFARTQFQSRFSDMKKDFKAVQCIRNASGFGWDDERKVTVC